MTGTHREARRGLAISVSCLALALLPSGSGSIIGAPNSVAPSDVAVVVGEGRPGNDPDLAAVSPAVPADPDVSSASSAWSAASATPPTSTAPALVPDSADAGDAFDAEGETTDARHRPPPNAKNTTNTTDTAIPRYTGQVVVKLGASPGPGGEADDEARVAQGITGAATAAGISVSVGRQTASGASVVDVGGTDPQVAAQRLAMQVGVEYAVPERRFTAAIAPGHHPFDARWHLREIRAPQAWSTATGAGVTVAVVDSGSLPHPDLTGRYLPGYDVVTDPADARDGSGRDPDPRDHGDWHAPGECDATTSANSSWHGLHVSSIIAARTNHRLGTAGVAPQARILPVRVLGRCGGTETDVTDGIVWAAGGTVPKAPVNPNPAKIINVSLGGPGTCSAEEQTAIDIARGRGALVVVAAGNDGRSVSAFSPANCRGVLAVASTTSAGVRASHSNYGPAIAVAAPGVAIWGLSNSSARSPSAQWVAVPRSGTSTAAPHVSATAALVWSLAPSLSADQVRRILVATAAPFGERTAGLGSGIIDAAAAVAQARPRHEAVPISTSSSSAARSGTGHTRSPELMVDTRSARDQREGSTKPSFVDDDDVHGDR